MPQHEGCNIGVSPYSAMTISVEALERAPSTRHRASSPPTNRHILTVKGQLYLKVKNLCFPSIPLQS